MTKRKTTGAGKALATTRSTAIQPARDTMHRMEGGGDLVRVDAVWDVAFLRRDQAGRPTVILSMRGSGPMQNMQTVWSLAFGTGAERDRFYEWLGHRLDRWPDWADLASEFGSQKLTHRLLGSMAASLDVDPPPVKRMIAGVLR